jgi:methionyl aminopeptidase
VIIIKSREELKRIAESCQIVAEALGTLKGAVAEGMTTLEIEKIADDVIDKRGAKPAFKGYKGYPSSVCTSVNNQVVHGIPSDRKLRVGDIVSIDLGVYLKGFYGDAAFTLPVGSISDEASKLLEVTEESLAMGVHQATAGNRVTDISNAVQKHAESNGFAVVRDFVGHGIGKQLHEEPQIPNFGLPGKGVRLREGMTLAIEPMVNAGRYEVVVEEDGWTAVTADGSLSAHFEHTVAVTDDGARVLTLIT